MNTRTPPRPRSMWAVYGPDDVGIYEAVEWTEGVACRRVIGSLTGVRRHIRAFDERVVMVPPHPLDVGIREVWL